MSKKLPSKIEWIDVTDTYAECQKQSTQISDVCDWGAGCNNKMQFRVTLKDGCYRHLCKDHLLPRLICCQYTHRKIEELAEV
jgi:hypothetical protein